MISRRKTVIIPNGMNQVKPTRSRRTTLRHFGSMVQAALTQKQKQHLKINVGGQRFEVYRSTLATYPDTRLYWLINSSKNNHIMEYFADTNEYFFDRDPASFGAVLNYYRTGKIHMPNNVCGPQFEDELNFWGIEESNIAPCCWNHYNSFRSTQATLNNLSSNCEDTYQSLLYNKINVCEENSAETTSSTDAEMKSVEFHYQNTWRFFIWNMIDNNCSTSKSTLIASNVSTIFVILSIIHYLVESSMLFTMPKLHEDEEIDEVYLLLHPYNIKGFSKIAHILIVTFFTCEWLIKLVVSPCRITFFAARANWVDISATIFAFLPILVSQKINIYEMSKLCFHLSRMPRVFRILKLTERLSGHRILVLTMKASTQELILLLTLFALFTVIWGSIIYVVENLQAENPTMTSLAFSFWWALITMSSVGYGDVVPTTTLGYIVGCCCTLCGVLVMALPVPIIVNNFALYYGQAQSEQNHPTKLKTGNRESMKSCLKLSNTIGLSLSSVHERKTLQVSPSKRDSS